MKVVVTGGSGMLGSALLERLSNETNCEIVALTRRNSNSTPLRERVRWMQGDLLSLETCKDIAENADVVFHLAHPSLPLSVYEDWVEGTTSSLRASLNLFSACVKGGRTPKIIFLSSGGAVYGEAEQGHAFEETELCKPLSIYGIEKLAIEHHLKLLALDGDLKGIVLRVSNAYGRLLLASRRQGVIGTILRHGLLGEPAELFGSLENIRDYVYVDDVCTALMKAFKYEASFDVFNIGSGRGYSVSDVICEIERALHRTLLTVEMPIKQCYLPRHVVLNVAKAKSILDWEAKVGLAQGIERMIHSYQRGTSLEAKYIAT